MEEPPIYTDSQYSSRSFDILKGNSTLFFLLLRNQYIYTFTCAFEVSMTFKMKFYFRI
jgi:hypothetical protein